jgi:hypothetical protein
MNSSRSSTSLVVAALALSLTTGGIGYAAGSLPKHSVGVKQLKKNAVTGKAIKAGAVTGDKVADGSLSGADLADGSLSGADLASNTVTGVEVDESSLAIPGSTGSLVLSGEDFKPRSYETTVQSLGNGGLYIAANGDYLTADLPVPSGATITKIVVYAMDDGSDSVDVRPVRDTPSTKTMTELAPVVASNGANTNVRALTVNLSAADDGVSDRRLLVQMAASSDYQLFGAVVSYTYTARLGG